METFNSTVGPLQGDALSSVLFCIYFEASLRKGRRFRNAMTFNNDEKTLEICCHPFYHKKAIYADDADFLIRSESEKNTIRAGFHIISRSLKTSLRQSAPVSRLTCFHIVLHFSGGLPSSIAGFQGALL